MNKYEPSRWNKNKYIRESHNCYSYFLNKIDKSVAKHCKKTYKKKRRCNKPQPGFYHGIAEKTRKNYNCKNMIKRIKLDNPSIIYKGKKNNFNCPKNHYKGALVHVTKKNKHCNYHFYRQDKNKLWSHKDGNQPATNLDAKDKLIKDPKYASQKYKNCNYDKQCGFFCIKDYKDVKNRLNMSHINKKK